MQISPVYDRPLVTFDGAPPVAPPLIRQRLRLLDVFADLSDDQWSASSRCEGWRVQDVAAHIVSVDRFWHASISSGLAGSPTKYLALASIPKATPAALVDAVRQKSPAETLAELRASTTALCDLVDGLSSDAWSVLAESPLGHVSMAAVAHHALWDAWIHERDIVLPLGLTPSEEVDEVLACLRNAAALNAGFALMAGVATPTTLVLETSEPDARVVLAVDEMVHAGSADDAPPDAVMLRGRAVDLVEMLSTRLPVDSTCSTRRCPTASAGSISGLAEHLRGRLTSWVSASWPFRLRTAAASRAPRSRRRTSAPRRGFASTHDRAPRR